MACDSLHWLESASVEAAQQETRLASFPSAALLYLYYAS